MNFCSRLSVINPFPLTESTLCRFVACLGQEGLKHRTIKSYLSGLRFAQIHQALGNPFLKDMPLLEYVLSGIKHSEARGTTHSDARLPITIQVLRNLKPVWLSSSPHPDSIMLWAASCSGFFGFLRAGEFTTPSLQAYDASVHLSLSDLAVDSHSSPSMVRLRIKQSKTDPFRQGVDVFLGATHADICPVVAMLQYLAVRTPSPGPLFVFQSGAPLTRASLVSHLRAALQKAGIPHSAYSGHSFRIGAATSAAQCGLEDSLIQTLGRWKSAAYKVYIRLPREQLASVSRALVGRTQP